MHSFARKLLVLIGLVAFGLLVVPPTLAQTNNCLDTGSFAFTDTSLTIADDTQNARATHWHPEGTLLFVVSRSTNQVVGYATDYPWTLHEATPTMALDVSDTVGTTDEGAHAHGLFVRDDGKKMWVFNRTEIWAYTLETAWDLSTATPTTYRALAEAVQRGHDIDFHPEGTHLYIDDRDGQAVYTLTLSTPWDIASGSWGPILDISAEEKEVRGLEFAGEGTVLFLMDTARQAILVYQLEVPYALETATYTGALDVSAEAESPRGLSVSADEQSLYVTGRDREIIFQYSISHTCGTPSNGHQDNGK